MYTYGYNRYILLYVGGDSMRKTVNYRIDEKILEDFNRLTKENAINRSRYMEHVMIKYIKEQKNK